MCWKQSSVYSPEQKPLGNVKDIRWGARGVHACALQLLKGHQGPPWAFVTQTEGHGVSRRHVRELLSGSGALWCARAPRAQCPRSFLYVPEEWLWGASPPSLSPQASREQDSEGTRKYQLLTEIDEFCLPWGGVRLLDSILGVISRIYTNTPGKEQLQKLTKYVIFVIQSLQKFQVICFNISRIARCEIGNLNL